ncbi:17117_t:CDS:2, partial [Gigaspora margarita]
KCSNTVGSLGSIELNLPLQTYAILDSSKDIDLDLYQICTKSLVNIVLKIVLNIINNHSSNRQKSALELDNKQPLSTIDKNLNQSNYEQLNFEKNSKQSYTIQIVTLKNIIFIL